MRRAKQKKRRIFRISAERIISSIMTGIRMASFKKKNYGNL